LARAVELVFEVIEQLMIEKNQSGPGNQRVLVQVSERKVRIESSLFLESSAWIQKLLSFEEQNSSLQLAQAMWSEKEFLTRSHEGLGAELSLAREILRRHGGELKLEGSTLELALPSLAPEEALVRVLESRALRASSEMTETVLALIRGESWAKLSELRLRVTRSLFRASDAVYELPGSGELALVMDDCKPADAPGLLARIARSVGAPLEIGCAFIPDDAIDAEQLILKARSRRIRVGV
jgi:hypothetical protein